MDKRPVRKTLVRNTKLATPPTKARREASNEISISKAIPPQTKHEKALPTRLASTKTTLSSASKADHDLRVPVVNSSKKLRGKLTIVNENRPKTALPKPLPAALNELITKSVNFPADRPVFKNLIPLKITAERDNPTVPKNDKPDCNTSGPDKEPSCAHLTKPKRMAEYSYIVKPIGKRYTLARSFESSRLFESFGICNT